MKKKLTLAALFALVLGFGAFNGPVAQAACGDGSEDVTVDDPDTSEDEAKADDTAYVDATGSKVYSADTSDGSGTPSGYIGTNGPRGYVEAGGDDGSAVSGSTAGSEVSGSVGTGGVCVNDNRVPPAS